MKSSSIIPFRFYFQKVASCGNLIGPMTVTEFRPTMLLPEEPQ